jgi:hypothetical protein
MNLQAGIDKTTFSYPSTNFSLSLSICMYACVHVCIYMYVMYVCLYKEEFLVEREMICQYRNLTDANWLNIRHLTFLPAVKIKVGHHLVWFVD